VIISQLIEELQKLPPYYPVFVLAPDIETVDGSEPNYLAIRDADTDNLHGAIGTAVILDARERI